MDWQIGSAARNPDRNILKESLMKNTKYMPKRDQVALEQDDYLAALMDALRESFRDGGAGMGVDHTRSQRIGDSSWGTSMGTILVSGMGSSISIVHLEWRNMLQGC